MAEPHAGPENHTMSVLLRAQASHGTGTRGIRWTEVVEDRLSRVPTQEGERGWVLRSPWVLSRDFSPQGEDPAWLGITQGMAFARRGTHHVNCALVISF